MLVGVSSQTSEAFAKFFLKIDSIASVHHWIHAAVWNRHHEQCVLQPVWNSFCTRSIEHVPEKKSKNMWITEYKYRKCCVARQWCLIIRSVFMQITVIYVFQFLWTCQELTYEHIIISGKWSVVVCFLYICRYLCIWILIICSSNVIY